MRDVEISFGPRYTMAQSSNIGGLSSADASLQPEVLVEVMATASMMAATSAMNFGFTARKNSAGEHCRKVVRTALPRRVLQIAKGVVESTPTASNANTTSMTTGRNCPFP